MFPALGEYAIPAIRQRPILLMGPPGIGLSLIHISVPLGVAKDGSLAELLRRMGLTRENLMACGDGLNAVSYTHLDVYKRQPVYSPRGTGCPAIEQAVQGLYKGQNEESFWSLMSALNYALELETHVPVSYTHLDVYKRQP